MKRIVIMGNYTYELQLGMKKSPLLPMVLLLLDVL